jgi:hypothetical protein
MYRVIVGVVIFAALACCGIWSNVCAQDINVNNCPNINGTWNFVQEKIIHCDQSPYPAPTWISTSGRVTFSQDEGNNCLFSAVKVIDTSNGDPRAGATVYFTGVIYGGGTKIAMQSIIKWNTGAALDYRVTSSSVFGDLTVNKKTKVGTKITLAGNSHMGSDFYSSTAPSVHCAESQYSVLTPQ